jgi:arylsulfatase A-like enzyme
MEKMFLILATVLMLSFEVAGQPPNIVVIISDDHGYNDLGCYGSKEVLSPHLDKLAAQGVRFTDFYVTSPVCTSSRAAFLTGRYPYRYGLQGLRPVGTDILDHDETLLSELLKTKNYTTAAIGKWHLGHTEGGLPTQRGFDYFIGLLEGVSSYYTHLFHGKDPALYEGTNVVHREGEYLTDIFTEEAVEFISDNQENPFFLYLAYNAPHYPMHVPPQQYLDSYGWVPGDVNDNRKKYRAMVTAMDAGIGRVLDTLDRCNLSDNTLVIFFSDNGGQNNVGGNNEPLRGEKHTDWEGGIRVPAIIRWPGRVTGPKVCAEPLCSMDLFDFICKAARVSIPRDLVLDTHDSSGLFLDGKTGTPRRDFFFRYGSKFFKGYAVRSGKYKLVKDSVSPVDHALYDLSNDPAESTDLSGKFPEKVSDMIKAYEDWYQEMKKK